MKATINGSNIEITRNGNKICTVTAENALELAANLKTAVADLARAAINKQQEALNASAALLEAATAS